MAAGAGDAPMRGWHRAPSETRVTCIKQIDAGLMIIDLVSLIFQQCTIKITHPNTHNFDVHFCNGKKSESPGLFY